MDLAVSQAATRVQPASEVIELLLGRDSVLGQGLGQGLARKIPDYASRGALACRTGFLP